MKVRIRHTPDNHWIVERKVLWYWVTEQAFYCWSIGSEDSTRNAALQYAQRLLNPTIIEVTQ